MFRPSDVRRVRAAMEMAVDPPFEADVSMQLSGLEIHVTITHPETGAPVANTVWSYQPPKPGSKLRVQQPSSDEIAYIARRMQELCAAYVALRRARQPVAAGLLAE